MKMLTIKLQIRIMAVIGLMLVGGGHQYKQALN